MAKLYFRYGAMNCGKTTALIQVAFNYEERGMRALVIKPSTDTKGEQWLVSRIGARRKADLLVPPELDLFEALRRENGQKKLDCVLCDEAQFLAPAQADQLFAVAVKLGIPVICYGLRADFLMNGFPGSTRLLEIAHTLEELKTICECGKKAMINGRMKDGEFVFEGDQVAIDDGGEISYRSLCPECYFRILEESRSKRQV